MTSRTFSIDKYFPFFLVGLLSITNLYSSFSTWYSAVAAALVPICFYFSGILILPRREIVCNVEIACALGMCMALIAWLLSAYIYGNVFLGSLALVSTTLAGGFKFYSDRNNFYQNTNSKYLIILATVGAVIFGYVIGNIFHNQEYIFSHRYLDWFSHLDRAGYVRENGLPLPGHLTHVGLFVLLAGISDFLAVNIYQASIILSLICFVILPLTSWHLLSEFSLPIWLRSVASIAPLLWGGLNLPLDLWNGDLAAMMDPYPRRIMPSGTLYHNLTQLVSVSLIAVFIQMYKQSCILKCQWFFLVTCLVLFSSGLVKPSGVIIFAPALLITLTLHAERKINFGMFFLSALFFYFLYFLPQFIVDDLPSREQLWLVAPDRLLDAQIVHTIFLLVGVSSIPLTMILGTIFSRVIFEEDSWHHLAAIATLGGLIFYALFISQGIGSKENGWSVKASLIIFSPLTIAYVYSFHNHVIKISLLVLTGLHLTSGLLYAINYKDLSKQSFDIREVVCQYTGDSGFRYSGINPKAHTWNNCY